MSDYVCSRCGAPAASDTRMGSVDTWLPCGCDRRGAWVNDGRGGYFSTNVQPIDAKDYVDPYPYHNPYPDR